MAHFFQPQIMGHAAVIAACGYALVKGGASEKIFGATYLAADFLEFFLINIQKNIRILDFAIVIDLTILLISFLLMLKYQRKWLIFTTAFQICCSFTHFFMIIDHKLDKWTYITALIIWGYIIELTLAYGTWQVHSAKIRAKSFAGNS